MVGNAAGSETRPLTLPMSIWLQYISKLLRIFILGGIIRRRGGTAPWGFPVPTPLSIWLFCLSYNDCFFLFFLSRICVYDSVLPVCHLVLLICMYLFVDSNLIYKFHDLLLCSSCSIYWIAARLFSLKIRNICSKTPLCDTEMPQK